MDVAAGSAPLAGLWRQRIAARRVSGQSIRVWCRERGFAEHSFYWWQAKLGMSAARQNRLKSAEPAEFVRVVVQPSPAGTSAAAQPPVLNGAEPSAVSFVEPIRLALAGGRELLLPASMPVEQIARLVHAIEGASPGQARRERVEPVEGASLEQIEGAA